MWKLFYNHATPLWYSPYYWSCAWTLNDYLTLCAVPSPWTKEGSWSQLPPLAAPRVLPSFLLLEVGESLSPMAAVVHGLSSLDEEADSSSEFVASTTLPLPFCGGVLPVGVAAACSWQWWTIFTDQSSSRLNRVSSGGAYLLMFPLAPAPSSAKRSLNHNAVSRTTWLFSSAASW
jgi:hypothetical protein